MKSCWEMMIVDDDRESAVLRASDIHVADGRGCGTTTAVRKTYVRIIHYLYFTLVHIRRIMFLINWCHAVF